MHYFQELNLITQERLFYRKPQVFDTSEQELLSQGLGAVLYAPADKSSLAQAVLKTHASTVVICLEDAVADEKLIKAHSNLIVTLEELNNASLSGNSIPFLFIRCRNLDHFKYVTDLIEPYKDILLGFVLPKFEFSTGTALLDFFYKLQKSWKKAIYLMPILESGAVLYYENRHSELEALKNLFIRYRDMILNVRIGATDMSGLFGLRRPVTMTVWDNALLSSTFADIVNCFSRKELNLTLSGPVWEYFKPKQNSITYSDHSDEIGGLLREVDYDLVNGFWGKSVIHPSQIIPVLSKMVTSYEDYCNADLILKQSGGVFAGVSNERMNEVKPHTFWAEKIVNRAHIYGVYNLNVGFQDLVNAYSELNKKIVIKSKITLTK